MANVFLDSERHPDLRVDTRAAPEYGDAVNRVAILSSEFGEAHKAFPILLRRAGGADEVSAEAILGFAPDENLFVDDGEWVSRYVPANVARGPFSLGYVPGNTEAGDPGELRVMIDESHPRVGTEGEVVFLELGGDSPYLQRVKQVLQTIDIGLKADRVFYPLLLELQLLEAVEIKVTADDGQQFGFADYLTIDRKRLAALTADELAKLNQRGMLALVFFLVSSMSNFGRLLARRRARQKARR